MTPHDWQLAPPWHEPNWKENASEHSPLIVLREPGVYICSRCGDDARIYANLYTSKNWGVDCDEVVVKKVHES